MAFDYDKKKVSEAARKRIGKDLISGPWEAAAGKAMNGATRGARASWKNRGSEAATGAASGANPRKNTMRRSNDNLGRAAAGGAITGVPANGAKRSKGGFPASNLGRAAAGGGQIGSNPPSGKGLKGARRGR